jgi:hypothetical protein
MAWQDRPYYRDSSSGAGNPLLWLLTGSVPLFTVFGVRVRMHAMMIIFIGLELLTAGTQNGLGLKNAVIAMSILWTSVLLHEFGHVFGCRWVGGEANEIVMWPLGGLAMVNPPRRWLPSFISTAAGPAVNLVICLITGTAVVILDHSTRALPLFPVFGHLRDYVPGGWTTYYLWWIFLVNWALLTFNMLLVFYPFDAGRMIQELLWARVGYYRSMMFATRFGMVGAVIAAMVGLALLWFTLILIAAFGFYTCYQQRMMLLEMGPEEYSDETDYSAAYDINAGRPAKRKKSRWFSGRAAKRARKIAAHERAERQKIDDILAKLSAHGMNSLTWWEKRTLRRATEQQRQRDAELSDILKK